MFCDVAISKCSALILLEWFGCKYSFYEPLVMAQCRKSWLLVNIKFDNCFQENRERNYLDFTV